MCETIKYRPLQSAMPSRNGFTLIELAIVLVIIGLVISGAMVGRDLIEASKVRAQISQIEQLNTAVNTFKLKYGHIPGDVPNATSIGLGTTSNHNGDGDGKIDKNCFQVSFNVTSPYQYNREAFALPVHLAAAGLIPNRNYPGYAGEAHGTWILNNSIYADKFIPSAYDPTVAIMPSQFKYSSNCGPLDASFATEIREGGNGWFFTNMPNSSATHGYINATLKHSTMYQIDTKIDDGLINAGKISISAGWGSTVHVLAPTSTQWGAGIYLPTSSTLLKPVIINQF